MGKANTEYGRKVQLAKKKIVLEKVKMKRQRQKLVQEVVDDTPDYIKQIFNVEKDEQPKLEVSDDESSVVETVKGADKKPYQKPNPFAKLQQQREMEQEKKLQERLERDRVFKEREAKKTAYQMKRQRDRKHMLQRTKSGQPVMRNVVHQLLDKIKKEVS